MKVRCIADSGRAFEGYKMPVGYFETSQFGEVEIGREYLVMGISTSQGLLAYLIDDRGSISFCPFMLFEVIDSRININWYFRARTHQDIYYPYREGTFGYYELCFDDDYLTRLLECEEKPRIIYFRRKFEVLLKEIKNETNKDLLKQEASLLEETISYFFSQIRRLEVFTSAIPYFDMLAFTKSELEKLIFIDNKNVSDKLYDFVKNFIWPLDLDQQQDLFEKIKQKKYFLELVLDR